MQPTFSIKQTVSKLSELGAAMRALTEQDVFIGVPEDKTARKEAGDTGISNAYLSYIHNNGVPEKGIPARESLLPGIADIQKDAVAILKKAAQDALKGKEGAVQAALNKIGLLGQNAVRARFLNNDWEPLADKTLDYQAARKDDDGKPLVNKKGELLRKKSRRERERTNPLIDTAQLMKAQTYVVRQKGNQALVVK